MKHILMIKECNLTGLKYLCKTSGGDPLQYHGSGVRWKLHYKKYHHNKPNIKTTILGEYDNKADLKKAGIYYSEKFNVVESCNWANLTPEQGDGGWINDQTGKHWKIKDTTNMKRPKTITDAVINGRKSISGDKNYQFTGWINTPWGKFASLKEATAAAKDARNNGNKEVISDIATLKKYLNNTEILNPEGRRTPKGWRGKTPLELGFRREEIE